MAFDSDGSRRVWCVPWFSTDADYFYYDDDDTDTGPLTVPTFEIGREPLCFFLPVSSSSLRITMKSFPSKNANRHKPILFLVNGATAPTLPLSCLVFTCQQLKLHKLFPFFLL